VRDGRIIVERRAPSYAVDTPIGDNPSNTLQPWDRGWTAMG